MRRQSANVIEILRREDAGAINDDVAAAEGLLHIGRHGRDGGFRRDVATAGQRLAAGLLDELYGLVRRGDVNDRDVHAILSEPFRERLPDAVRRAGDDGDFVLVDLSHVSFPFLSRHI